LQLSLKEFFHLQIHAPVGKKKDLIDTIGKGQLLFFMKNKTEELNLNLLNSMP
jgi:hypothetical protein